jgi:hypothetical protein
VEDEQNARPPHSLAVFFWLIGVQGLKPFVGRNFCRTDAPEGALDGDEDGRDKSALAKGRSQWGEQVHREELQKERPTQTLVEGQQVFSIPLGIQRVAMVVGMAAGITAPAAWRIQREIDTT